MSETETKKKPRGPMSEDARVLLAKRKLGTMTPAAAKLALTEIGAEKDEMNHGARADELDAVAAFLRVVAPLSYEGLVTLRKLVS